MPSETNMVVLLIKTGRVGGATWKNELNTKHVSICMLRCPIMLIYDILPVFCIPVSLSWSRLEVFASKDDGNAPLLVAMGKSWQIALYFLPSYYRQFLHCPLNMMEVSYFFVVPGSTTAFTFTPLMKAGKT